MTVNATLKRTEDVLPKKGFWRMEQGAPLIACGSDYADRTPHHHHLRAWNVDKDGKVTPSVQCLNKKCMWHAMVTLEGWVP